MNSILPAMSMLLYVTVSIRIWFHKRKMVTSFINVNLPIDQEVALRSVRGFHMAKIAQKSTLANLAVMVILFNFLIFKNKYFILSFLD